MDCQRARELLWPPERLRIANTDTIAAERHLETCASCRAHFAIDDVLADAREALRETVAPNEVRKRVFEAVGRARAAAGHVKGNVRTLRGVAVASAIMAALSAAVLITRSIIRDPVSRDPSAAFVEDYMRLAVREDHITTSDAGEVRRFLLRELGTPVEPIDAPGLLITGAEVCLLEGRRGALIRYQTEQGIVSYYLLPQPGIDDRPPTAHGAQTGSGATLVTWASDEIERALVGPLPEDRLLGMARTSR